MKKDQRGAPRYYWGSLLKQKVLTQEVSTGASVGAGLEDFVYLTETTHDQHDPPTISNFLAFICKVA